MKRITDVKMITPEQLLNRKWFYILEGKTPVNCDFWQYEKADRSTWILKKSEPVPGVEVSTIFLGVNLDWRSVDPICFETMIFGGKHDMYRHNYTNYDDAIDHHNKICLKLFEEQNE